MVPDVALGRIGSGRTVEVRAVDPAWWHALMSACGAQAGRDGTGHAPGLRWRYRRSPMVWRDRMPVVISAGYAARLRRRGEWVGWHEDVRVVAWPATVLVVRWPCLRVPMLYANDDEATALVRERVCRAGIVPHEQGLTDRSTGRH